jgi:hypothetical protein
MSMDNFRQNTPLRTAALFLALLAAIAGRAAVAEEIRFGGTGTALGTVELQSGAGRKILLAAGHWTP